MISRWFSAQAFTLTFGLCYAVAVFGHFPLFRYYPLVSRFSFQDLADPSLGPAMAWYGWISTALIPAAVASLIVPKRALARIPPISYWIVIALMLTAAGYREYEWFAPA